MTQYVQRQAEPKNGFGIAALCLAIPGLVFGLVPLTGFLAAVCGGLALIFGLLGYGRAKRGQASNRKMSVISSILGATAVALGIWGMTIVFDTVEEIDKEFDRIGTELNESIDIE